MKINVLFEETEDRFNLGSQLNETGDTIDVEFESSYATGGGTSDYNRLKNKPSINSVTLEGALSAEDLGLGRVYYDTTANWNLNPGLMSERGVVYIYSDYEYLEDEVGNRTPIAGLRIGDGSSYLIDLPFVSSLTTRMLIAHIANQTAHISEAEREFWNNKVSAFLDPQDAEALILSKTQYELNGEIRSKE